ncbi:MAG: helix-turn-helix transcriptional regulator [Actinomycetota bacterium]
MKWSPVSDVRTLGYRLRAARLKAGMSQTALSLASGLPKPTLSRYENDHVAPSLGSLNRLAMALDVSESSLLDGTDSPDAIFLASLEAHGVVISSAEEAERFAALVADTLAASAAAHVSSA